MDRSDGRADPLASSPRSTAARRRGNGRRGVVAVLSTLLLVAAATACGSGRDDAASNPATTDTAAPAGDSFGTLASPCGPGDAGGATDTGVTDDAVTIGYGDDAGYPGLPGAGHQMTDAVEAMIEWCNAQGGIEGRTVKGNYYDAKITEVTNAMAQACQDGVFMMVGEGYVFDSGQEEIRLGCDLPAIPSYGTSPAFANGRLTYQPVPNPIDRMQVTLPAWYAATYPERADKVAIMAPDLAASKDTAAKEKSSWPKVGITFVPCDITFNIAGEPDWRPFVQRLKDCGAEAVSFMGTANPSLENLLEAADLLDYHPDWLLDASFYDQSFADWNVQGWADRIHVQLTEVPFEYASVVPATQDYIDIVTGTGGDISDLGVHAASAFLLWATAAKACGSELTRTCVLDELASTHDWDGGGLSGPADVGDNLPPECGLVVGLEGTSYVQVFPAEGGTFDCRPANVQTVEGEVVANAGLGPDRRVD